MMKNLNKHFSPKSAGRKMISNVPKVKPENTIADIESLLLRKIRDIETINYIYVINDQNKLLGVVSIKELFCKPKETKVDQIMEEKLVFAHPHTHQERVALLAIQHNLKAIPVVDKTGVFLGVVSSDTILGILHNESVEDALHTAGVHKFGMPATAVIKASVSKLIKLRLPWLLFGLFGGVFAAQIVGFFEDALRTNLILAMFIPAIVYMTGATATQTEILFIKSLTINHHLILKNYFLKEIKVGLAIAFICGLILSFISLLWWKMPFLGLILGISLFFAIFLAILIGMLIPWILNRLKKDPAIGTGPFATIITDILSLLVYFSIASVMLKLFY
jgi:magnesium transporter